MAATEAEALSIDPTSHDKLTAALRDGFTHPAPISSDPPTPDPNHWDGRIRVGAWMEGINLGSIEATANPTPEQAARDAASALAATLDPTLNDAQRAKIALEIEIAHAPETVTPEGLNDLIATTELGLHGLVLTDTKTGKTAAGWPAVAQRKYSGAAQWVKSLLKEARPPGARLPASVRVERFPTTHLRLSPNEEAPTNDATPQQLHGGLRVVQQSDLTRHGLAAAATEAAAWLVRHQLANGLYRYEFQPAPAAPSGATAKSADPTAGTWATSDSIVRQAGCAWSIAALATAYRGEQGEGPKALGQRFTASAMRAIGGLTKNNLHRNGPGGLHYLAGADGQARLGAIPLLLLAFTDLRLTKYQPKLQQKLTRTCLALQQPDGSFGTSVRGLEMEGSERYFAGQIALALARRYFVDKRPRTDEAVRRTIAHYRQRWNAPANNAGDDPNDGDGSDEGAIKNLSFAAWMLQACESHVRHTPDADSKANATGFVFEMADWALTQQHGTDHPNPLWVGGYQGSPGIGTAAYTEGMIRALVVATLVEDQDRIERYGRAVATGLRFLLQLQIDRSDLPFVGVEDHLGAVRGSLRRRNLRCDNAQHFGMAMFRASVLRKDEDLQLAQ